MAAQEDNVSTSSMRRQSSKRAKKPPNIEPTPKEQERLDKMMTHLTADELETAAKTSYEYLNNPEPYLRQFYAQKIMLRYLQSKRHNLPKALSKLKDTLAFRKEINIDALRTAFDSDNECTEKLSEQLAQNAVTLGGKDLQGRSTYMFLPRNVESHDAEWTIKQHVFVLERAIESSEAPDQSVNAVVDFTGFSVLRHSPPTQIGKDFMLTFRNHYAGVVNQIFLVDAPSTFLCLWSIFKPLLSKTTRDKIHFVNSKKPQKIEAVFGSGNMPWKTGKIALTST